MRDVFTALYFVLLAGAVAALGVALLDAWQPWQGRHTRREPAPEESPQRPRGYRGVRRAHDAPTDDATVHLPGLPEALRVEPPVPVRVHPHHGATEDWSPTAELAAVPPSDWTDAEWEKRRNREDHDAMNAVEDEMLAGLVAWHDWALDTLGVTPADRLDLARHEDSVRAGATGEIELAELRELLDAEEVTVR